METKSERRYPERIALLLEMVHADDRDREMRLEGFRKQGREAGAAFERARIRAVEQQGLPGHEALVMRLKFDGKTTGEQAAAQILVAEREKLAGMSGSLCLNAPRPARPAETTTRVTRKADATPTPDQVAALARQEWQNDLNLHREFTGEGQYLAFRKAEAQGRVRIARPKTQ